MTTPPTRTVGKLKQTIRRWLPQRRDDSGLTTLEWLLIVAAVAGLAALAVVLVQNVVGDTSEQIAGSSARKTAAQIAAIEIMANASRSSADQPDSADTAGEWLEYYRARCNRLKITYGDAGLTVFAHFAISGATDSVMAAADVLTGDVTATVAVSTATTTKAQAHCRVT